MAETHITHLQNFQGLLEAVKCVMGTGKDAGEVKEISTSAGLKGVMSGLGRG